MNDPSGLEAELALRGPLDELRAQRVALDLVEVVAEHARRRDRRSGSDVLAR